MIVATASPPLFEKAEYMYQAEIIQEISPGDTMYSDPPAGEGREQYFQLGDEATRRVRQAMQVVGMDEPATILDLACGHGRVLRTLKAAFPQAKLTACDIDRDGVDFCARTFGAEPHYSAEDPRQISFSGGFELIWCGSLLTHLDDSRFAGLLKRFEDTLDPGGLVVFTTSGNHAFRMLRNLQPGGDTREAPLTPVMVERAKGYFPFPDDVVPELAASYEKRGFAYSDYYEGGVRTENHGGSLSSPAWVCKQLARLPGLRLVSYVEQGWGSIQDVVACQRRSNRRDGFVSG